MYSFFLENDKRFVVNAGHYKMALVLVDIFVPRNAGSLFVYSHSEWINGDIFKKTRHPLFRKEDMAVYQSIRPRTGPRKIKGNLPAAHPKVEEIAEKVRGNPQLVRITQKPTAIEARKSNALAREKEKIEGWEEDVWEDFTLNGGRDMAVLGSHLNRSASYAAALDKKYRKKWGLPPRKQLSGRPTKEGQRVLAGLMSVC